MLTGMLQPTHLIILLAIALIVLGPSASPAPAAPSDRA
jgi:Sec-independent protein translocase protein TatA